VYKRERKKLTQLSELTDYSVIVSCIKRDTELTKINNYVSKRTNVETNKSV